MLTIYNQPARLVLLITALAMFAAIFAGTGSFGQASANEAPPGYTVEMCGVIDIANTVNDVSTCAGPFYVDDAGIILMDADGSVREVPTTGGLPEWCEADLLACTGTGLCTLGVITYDHTPEINGYFGCAPPLPADHGSQQCTLAVINNPANIGNQDSFGCAGPLPADHTDELCTLGVITYEHTLSINGRFGCATPLPEGHGTQSCTLATIPGPSGRSINGTFGCAGPLDDNHFVNKSLWALLKADNPANGGPGLFGGGINEGAVVIVNGEAVGTGTGGLADVEPPVEVSFDPEEDEDGLVSCDGGIITPNGDCLTVAQWNDRYSG